MRLKYDLDPLLNIFWPTRVTQKEKCTKTAIFIFHQAKRLKNRWTSLTHYPSCVMLHCQYFYPSALRARSEWDATSVCSDQARPGDKDVCNSSSTSNHRGGRGLGTSRHIFTMKTIEMLTVTWTTSGPLCRIRPDTRPRDTRVTDNDRLPRPSGSIVMSW